MPRGLPLSIAVLLLVALASAQEFNVAIGLGGRPAAGTILDEITDPRERGAFRELWEGTPKAQIGLARRFIEQYPRSVLLRETYELAARAHVAEGDLAQGLAWAARALRLMPENPFLLVMVADVAAKQRDFDLAAESARDAPASSAPVPTLSLARGVAAPRHLRAALFKQDASRRQIQEAEQALVASLTRSRRHGALYARFNRGGGARGMPRAHFARGEDRWRVADAARQSLHVCMRAARRPRSSGARAPAEPAQPAARWTAARTGAADRRCPLSARRTGVDGDGACSDIRRTSWRLLIRRSLRSRTRTDGRTRHFIEIRRGDNGEWVRYPSIT